MQRLAQDLARSEAFSKFLLLFWFFLQSEYYLFEVTEIAVGQAGSCRHKLQL